MTTYSELADKLLIALYQEGADHPGGIHIGYLLDRYGLKASDAWLRRICKEWGLTGLAEVED